MIVGPENQGEQIWHEDKLFDEETSAVEEPAAQAEEPGAVPPEVRLQEYSADKDTALESKNIQLLRDFSQDLGINLFNYEDTNDIKQEEFLETEQDRVQLILCKLIFDTPEKRHLAIETIASKIIPTLREELEEARRFEDRYQDNEIPRGPKEKSGDLELDVKGAEALINLIAAFDHPRQSISSKRTQKEAELEHRSFTAAKKEQKEKTQTKKILEATQTIIETPRTITRGEKTLTLTLDDSIMDLALRLAQQKLRKHPDAEAKTINDRYSNGLLQYLKENLTHEQHIALAEIYHKREEAQAKVVDKLTRDSQLHELTSEKRIALEEEGQRLKVLQEAAEIAHKTIIF